MNDLKIFKSPEFGTVRTISIDGEPYFVGIDIANKLEYQNGSRDINAHVDECDRITVPIFDGKQTRQTIVINESGMYSLVFGSKMPQAKQFKRWVTHEVLPAIRQNGGYIAGQEQMNEQELLAKALMVAQATIERREFVIKKLEEETEEMRPKALFADAVAASDTSILIRDFAKILKQNGVDTGEKRFYKWLRQKGYIVHSSTRPTQKAMDLGLFEIIESTIQRADLPPLTTMTTKITGKGQQYFINKILGEKK